ncbi:bifunctional methylenetetrahydrofolate dehydrogenase/methenyltetrahydrofolate cyclohydrolase FolD [Erysipelothrix sp. HDW6C]|uniref:bifunctional methylenetetrahydrofolate dehydrogenase/methenyltetrahydrofolate cyclohydrolase FolD n=1 Tax=Erysipelothrix sp. HDW6C TaxID=2714930 RepID=UPI00140A4149|nr:bifunctional methylenetetrahydrofolate dehydrogenase/methenyltetrahydrofolate cyclohydrolase FolD [Erysipelothrix sp. HDW6C]QIK69012.1 bifunctional methylenetetrahydrofolate dehydrogenase/methenyltetrahydrofolate cyclohydrolase FolD [Erysipelothrix sp. HDW6C]
MGTLLDGFMVSKAIRSELKDRVAKLISNGKRVPCLAVIIVGEDPASQTYVNSKAKQSKDVGYTSQTIALPTQTTQEDLISAVEKLNHDNNVDGILVQLPLPQHIDEDALINAIAPEKDVDGLHPLNVGYLNLGEPTFIPCTPKGIIRLLDWYNINLEGKRALVIGRSRLVGKPIAALLMARNATVTVAHSKTTDLNALLAEAEIIVVAMGRPEFIKAEHIKANQVLVDVGIHRGDGKIIGDVEHAAYEKAAFATPVPKGVGPMTIASLLENTMEAYLRGDHHE